MVISYRRFGTNYRSHLNGSRVRCNFLPTFRDNLFIPSTGVKNLWSILTDVSGQTIGHIFTGQESVVISYQRFGTTSLSLLQGSRIYGQFLPTFRDKLFVPSTVVKNLWSILTDVSGQPIGPIFTGQESVVIFTDVSRQPMTYTGVKNLWPFVTDVSEQTFGPIFNP